MHPLDASDDITKKFVGIGIQPVVVALPEQLRIGLNGAQGLLKIVAGYIGKLLQVGVRARQLLSPARQGLLSAKPFGDISLASYCQRLDRSAALTALSNVTVRTGRSISVTLPRTCRC